MICRMQQGSWEQADYQQMLLLSIIKSRKGLLEHILAENRQSKSKLGRKTVLSPQQEKELSKRIIRLARTGCPITLTILRMCVCVHILWEKQYSKFICEGKRNGWSCLDSFLRRNPMIASHKAQNLNPGRAQKLNHFLKDYFAKL